MKNVFFLLICLIIFPFNVNANVVCNDGTVSPSCEVCGRGCCSHHGGCSNNYSSSSSNNKNDSSNGNNNYNNDDNETTSSYSDEDYEDDVIEDLDIKEVYLEISLIVSGFSFLIYLIIKSGMRY